MIVVISQPMYFPWYGLFEQMRQADIFVHYDDVQLPNTASFMTRVQINAHNNISWLSLPIRRVDGSATKINKCLILQSGWQRKHLMTLEHAYKKASHFDEMYQLALSVINYETDNLAEFTINSVETVARYFNFSTVFKRSSQMQAEGHKTERLLSICKQLGATTYITGKGALDYLNHQLFEENGIRVHYPKYNCMEFKHINSTFTQYVSILDFIAHCGKSSVDLFQTEFTDWREHI